MDKILKIYKFPKGIRAASEWVALYENDRFHSWNYHAQMDIKKIKEQSFGTPVPIIDHFYHDYGKLAQSCLDGKEEQYLVWFVAKKEVNAVFEEKNVPSCTCPDENFKFFGIGCNCGAMKKTK